MLSQIVGRLLGAARRTPARTGLAAPGCGSDDAADFARLNPIAPLLRAHAAGAATPENGSESAQAAGSPSIVSREAILGRDQRVKAYAFFLRQKVNQRLQHSRILVRRSYDEVLLRNLQRMGVQRLLGHRLAFISLSSSSLDLPIVEQLPAQGTVYVIQADGEPTEFARDTLPRLARLRGLGYRIGLNGQLLEQPEAPELLQQADFVLVDIGGSDIPLIKARLDTVRTLNPGLGLVATNILAQEDFAVCARLPFALFQGDFMTRREEWDSPPMDAARAKLLMLLNRLRGEAEWDELASLIRQDPALSFKLLRYVNSPGMGLLTKVAALDQALLILGRQKLYRWLTLLLFTGGEPRPLDRALMENALVRARLCESLAAGRLDATAREELFVAGVFSLLDVLMAMPMAAILEQVSLPPLVTEVLLKREGCYAPYLELAEACEQNADDTIAALAEALDLSAEEVNNLHLDALVWAQEAAD